MQKNNNRVKTLVLIGVLSALVFATSWLSIPISNLNRIHFGNIMSLLSGIIFGPVIGGLSAGIGSMLYDFTNPLFMPEFWITFINKFLMAFVAGALYKLLENRLPKGLSTVVSAFFGALTYSILFLFKMSLMLHFVNGSPWPVVFPVVWTNAVISLVNGLLSVAATAILAPILKKALAKSGLISKAKTNNKHVTG